MEKEQWKEEILNSLKGMKPAEPNAFLFTRLEAKLQKAGVMPRWQLSLAAIVLVLLLTANTLVMLGTFEKSTPSAQNEDALSFFQAY